MDALEELRTAATRGGHKASEFLLMFEALAVSVAIREIGARTITPCIPEDPPITNPTPD